MDRDRHSLREPINHVRAQRARPFEEVTEKEDVESDLCGNIFQRPATAVNGAAQVTTDRVLRGRLVQALTALSELRQFRRDFLPVAAKLLQQFRGYVP